MGRIGRYIPNTLRINRGLFKYKQKVAAKKIGVDPSDLSRWESGEIIPSLATAFKLRILYGRPIEELFPAYFREIEAEIQNLNGRSEEA